MALEALLREGARLSFHPFPIQARIRTMGRGKSFFGGLLGVFFLSVIVFLIIYFFVPAVSMKFFGLAYDESSTAGSAIVSAIDELDIGDEEARAELEAYLSSEEGQEAVSRIQSAMGKAGEGFETFLASDKMQTIVEGAKSAGKSAVDYISQLADNPENP